VGRVASSGPGGCTINWRGIVIRCGEQSLQTTLPHFLQWCRRNIQVKDRLQMGHSLTSESGCQRGTTYLLELLEEVRLSRLARGVSV
jgi:hypothetical protein